MYALLGKLVDEKTQELKEMAGSLARSLYKYSGAEMLKKLPANRLKQVYPLISTSNNEKQGKTRASSEKRLSK